jgi:acetylornithine deacetylase/succinyl-diaminopimelate desuccinylase-like protein
VVRAVRSFAKRKYPGATISFPVLLGFTDSHYFRTWVSRATVLPIYGPAQTVGGGYHGNDERISRQAFLDGIRNYYEVVTEISK